MTDPVIGARRAQIAVAFAMVPPGEDALPAALLASLVDPQRAWRTVIDLSPNFCDLHHARCDDRLDRRLAYLLEHERNARDGAALRAALDTYWLRSR